MTATASTSASAMPALASARAHRRHHRLRGGPGRDLGHDAAEAGVLVHARGEGVAEQDAVLDEADPGLVAGGLDAHHDRHVELVASAGKPDTECCPQASLTVLPHHHRVDPAVLVVAAAPSDVGEPFGARTARWRGVVDAHLEEQFPRAALASPRRTARRACARARPCRCAVGTTPTVRISAWSATTSTPAQPSSSPSGPRPRRSSGCACRRARRGSRRRPRLGAEHLALVRHQLLDVRAGHRHDRSTGCDRHRASPSAARHPDGAGTAG